MERTNYDLFIIGGGQAGIPLAREMAKAGKRVALAERKYLGGSCVNFGCTPTKAAIASARLAHQARRAAEYGIRIPTIEVDFPSVIARARRIAGEFRQGLDQGFETSENPKLFRGHARIVGRDAHGFCLKVDDREFTARQVVLNTGTRSLIPPIEGLDRVNVIHAGNWLDHSVLPEHLVVVGGGYIGLEMGQFYRRMGSRVTVIEPSDRVIGHEDEEISHALLNCLTVDGVVFHLKTCVTRVEVDGGITLRLEAEAGSTQLRASHLFVATGRQPNTDDLGLDTIGVAKTEQGYVVVDERLATDVDGLWAAGDIRGGPLFTHTAWDDYRVLMSQLQGNGTRTTKRIVPYAVFTDPELGRVGMTEAEARRSGRPIKTARFDMVHNGKANEIGETDGFIKVTIDAETNRLLGAAILGADAAELVHMYVDVMSADAPYAAIRDAIHIHPTLAEAVQSAVAALDEGKG